ncbi:hypothetical protein DL96DRAFT_1565265 [Flagelloscypha sp. PMI_526]|nr:hypothetical protein DL96DRAFT_1565265 [Flagelloscypha sp. PMI_526]
MSNLLADFRRSSLNGSRFILRHSTLYPLLHELATKPHLSPEDLEHHSESLEERSKMIMNSLLAAIGLTWSASPTSQLSMRLIHPFIILVWCIINRMYYEGLPLTELQKSGPVTVAILYVIPEFYSVVFVTSQVIIYGGLVGTAILVVAILIQLLLRYLPAFHTRRNQVRFSLLKVTTGLLTIKELEILPLETREVETILGYYAPSLCTEFVVKPPI